MVFYRNPTKEFFITNILRNYGLDYVNSQTNFVITIILIEKLIDLLNAINKGLIILFIRDI